MEPFPVEPAESTAEGAVVPIRKVDAKPFVKPFVKPAVKPFVKPAVKPAEGAVDEPVVEALGASAFASVPAPLRAALERRGFTTLTSVQANVLDSEHRGRDLRISSQTGSGKTAALGMVMTESLLASGERTKGPRLLVITPTRELAVQFADELTWLYADLPGVRVDWVTGGTNVGQERQRLKRRPAVLVGTPGRLVDHIKNGALDCSSIRHLVLDEADQMLDMGFRDELEAIVVRTPEERRTHLVSATFPNAVRQLTKRYQKSALEVEGTSLGAAHEDIEHVGHMVRGNDRYAALVNLLLLAEGERTLVFVRTRIDATELAEKLARDGFSALSLSGDLQQTQRTRTLNAFRNGAARTLVATDVAARGIDVADVASVVHFNPPHDADIYTHRSGRTGRAGSKGSSVLLATPSQSRHLEYMLSGAGVGVTWRPIPGAAAVRKQVQKKARRRLYADLELVDGPAEAHREYARKLLSERDAEMIIATLLSRTDSDMPREPADVSSPNRIASNQPDRLHDAFGVDATAGGQGHAVAKSRQRSVDRGFQVGVFVHRSISA